MYKFSIGQRVTAINVGGGSNVGTVLEIDNNTFQHAIFYKVQLDGDDWFGWIKENELVAA